MSAHESPIIRRKSRQIMVGNVPVGGDAPITVQTMTNTKTTDVAATRDEHFQRWHGGNWQNDTYGSPNNPSWPEEF